jgi:hypothetical protein
VPLTSRECLFTSFLHSYFGCFDEVPQEIAKAQKLRVSRCEICSLCGEALEQTKKQFPQHTRWAVEQHADSWDKCFEGQMKSIVYLTADSPEEILTLDKDCVYIVGGIVDRNRYPQLCLQKAGTHGVRTARLPIDAHLKLTGSKVRCSAPVCSIPAHAAVLCSVRWRWPQGPQKSRSMLHDRGGTGIWQRLRCCLAVHYNLSCMIYD